MGTEDRENNVAEVLVATLTRGKAEGPILVVGEKTGRVQRALSAAGCEVSGWSRFARGDVAGTPEPPSSGYAAIALRQPKSRPALKMTLHLLASRLGPSGVLTLAGANGEGIRSCGKTLKEVFEEVKVVDARRHCRVWEARVPRSDLRASVDAWQEELEADSPLGKLRWWSYPGCFAHGRLDEGSCRLMRHLPETTEPFRALDFACGAGALSLALKQRCPQVVLDLTDADSLAVRAAQRALPEARVGCRDGLIGLEGRTYDLIVSNPPLHDGVQSDRQVLERFLSKVRDHLNPDGVLLLVTERSIQIPSMVQLKDMKSLEEGQGFRVWTGRR